MSVGSAFRGRWRTSAAVLLISAFGWGLAGCGGGGTTVTGPAEEPSVGPGAAPGANFGGPAKANAKGPGSSSPGSAKPAGKTGQ